MLSSRWIPIKGPARAVFPHKFRSSSPEAVHVTVLRIHGSFDPVALLDDLNEAERERATRGDHSVRLHFVVGRALLRRLIGDRTGFPARDVALVESERGPTTPYAGVEFSLAHSGPYVMVALSRTAVGIDVERATPVTFDGHLVRRSCTPREIEQLSALEDEIRGERFVSLWARKEAVVKAHPRPLRPSDIDASWAEPRVLVDGRSYRAVVVPTDRDYYATVVFEEPASVVIQSVPLANWLTAGSLVPSPGRAVSP